MPELREGGKAIIVGACCNAEAIGAIVTLGERKTNFATLCLTCNSERREIVAWEVVDSNNPVIARDIEVARLSNARLYSMQKWLVPIDDGEVVESREREEKMA